MKMVRNSTGTAFRSQRWSVAGPPAAFAATYRPIGEPFQADPETLEHFLTERYHLFSSAGDRIWRGDISHPRWTLQVADAGIERNSMLAAAGLHQLGDEPLLRHFAAFQDVRFWSPVRVG